MWELGHKEGWVPKNWCFWTVVLEKTLESPSDCKEIKLVNPTGNQPWIFIGRIDAEAEAPILWPPDGKSQIFGKEPDAGKDWRLKENGIAEDEMVRQHHWLNGHEFGQTLGDSGGQRSLVCFRAWGCKELDTTWSTTKTTGLVARIQHSQLRWPDFNPWLGIKILLQVATGQGIWPEIRYVYVKSSFCIP